MSGDTKKNRRKWSQWSLLTLMFFALSISLFIVPFVNRAEHVRFWQKVKDSENCEIEIRSGEPSGTAKSLKIPWLLNRIFPDVSTQYFDNVTSIYLEKPNEELQTEISKHMRGCTNLLHLHWHGRVSDQMARDIRRCESLTLLKLNDCSDTDTFLKNLSALKSLQIISLNQCQISKSGIDELKRMNQLKLILMFKTEISQSAIEELRAELPNCYVFAFSKEDLKQY